MSPENHALIVDLVAWVAARPRSYAETMDAWRTSCPRLTIWEDALEQGLVACERSGTGSVVRATRPGLALLRAERRLPQPSATPAAA